MRGMPDPLLSQQRDGSFERSQELAAYEGLRELILSRRIGVGDPIRVEELGDVLDVEPQQLQAALVRLSTEFLVVRDRSGEFRAAAMTTAVADALFDARTVIELGVIEEHGASIPSEALHELDRLADELARIVAEPMPDLERFLAASHDYHARLVGLAGSPPLSAAYLRLGISRLWRSSIADLDWWNLFDVRHHGALTEALRGHDLGRAKQLVREHQAQVKGLVREVIARGGGVL